MQGSGEGQLLPESSSPNANDELTGPEEPDEMVEEHPLQAMVPNQFIGAVGVLSACQRTALHCKTQAQAQHQTQIAWASTQDSVTSLH